MPTRRGQGREGPQGPSTAKHARLRVNSGWTGSGRPGGTARLRPARPLAFGVAGPVGFRVCFVVTDSACITTERKHAPRARRPGAPGRWPWPAGGGGGESLAVRTRPAPGPPVSGPVTSSRPLAHSCPPPASTVLTAPPGSLPLLPRRAPAPGPASLKAVRAARPGLPRRPLRSSTHPPAAASLQSRGRRPRAPVSPSGRPGPRPRPLAPGGPQKQLNMTLVKVSEGTDKAGGSSAPDTPKFSERQ